MVSFELPDPAEGDELDPPVVAALIPRIASGDIRLIDCREPEEWDIVRLEEAELIPLSSFADSAVALAKSGTPCIVYCHHGMRSLSATRWLRERGLSQTWSMRGGIHAWATAVDPSLPRY